MTEEPTPDTPSPSEPDVAENLSDSAAMPDEQHHTDPVGDKTDPVGDNTDPVGNNTDPVDEEIRPPQPPPTGESTAADPTDSTATAGAPVAIRRLRRLVRGRPVGPLEAKLGGVSAGIGRYLSIEPIYLRAAFAVALLFNGVGALLYAAAWLLIPNDDDRRPQPIAPTDSVVRLVAGVVVLLGGLAVIADPFSVDVGDIFVPLVLIAAGVWFLDRRPDINPPTRPAPPTIPTANPAPWDPIDGPGAGSSAGLGSTALLDPPAPTAHWATPLASEPEARVPVATISIAATAALFGLVLLLDSVDAIDPDPIVYAAIPALGFGAGLVASSLIRGARSGLLILLSLTSLVPLALSAAAGPALFGGVGESRVIVRDAEPDSRYRWGIGEQVVDLRDAEVDGLRDVQVDQAFGSIRIIVPADVDVEVDAAVQGGSVTVFGFSSDGTDVQVQRRAEGDGGELDDGDLLRLDVDLRFGEIVVIR